MPEANEQPSRLIDDMFDDTEQEALKADLDSDNLPALKEKLATKGITSETDVDTVLSELAGGEEASEEDVKHALSEDQNLKDLDELAFWAEHKKAVRMRLAVRIVVTQLTASGTRVTKEQFESMVSTTYKILKAFS